MALVSTSWLAGTLIAGHSLVVPSLVSALVSSLVTALVSPWVSTLITTLVTTEKVAIIVATISTTSTEVRSHAWRRVRTVITWASYGTRLMKIVASSASSLIVVATTKLLVGVVIVVSTAADRAWTANSARASTLVLTLVCVVIIVVRVGIEDIPREGITLTPTATIHFSE